MTLEATLLTCPNVKRVETLRDRHVLVEVETLIGTTLALPGLDLAPRTEAIDRFTPWLDKRLRYADTDIHGTIPKSYRLKREIRFCDTPVTLHLCIAPRQWGIMATVLSSSDRFAKRLTASRAHGGLLPDGWHIRDEGVVIRADNTPVIAHEEVDFFTALSLPFVPRHLRK